MGCTDTVCQQLHPMCVGPHRARIGREPFLAHCRAHRGHLPRRGLRPDRVHRRIGVGLGCYRPLERRHDARLSAALESRPQCARRSGCEGRAHPFSMHGIQQPRSNMLLCCSCGTFSRRTRKL
ncbi:hypothetical protein ABB37_00445 [Leptomonas pyrrhocoris]|uniref:Uncharacterized protein n=1 Tax=Leptomonas pyrrhocoris TaxID=157538 RepID=A0A0N0E0A1_LEPPY|nr:hypothetical protein ABB37_00445 [Leptomonas pyrrhocoris]KPA86205.1 hypothetical protein ABB37_00445 [Leptomonas pyrrhocoris]|eukprot:XP_015664644.1 hypothetical protein ABB37_00445 [Leptomonas pyrrhocoris]